MEFKREQSSDQVNEAESSTKTLSVAEMSEETQSAPHKKSLAIKILVKIVKFAILAISILALVKSLSSSWSQTKQIDWDLHYGWLVLSGVCYLIGFLPSSLFWYVSMKSLGQSPSKAKTIISYYFSQIGKYVPGKAMIVIIRTGLISGKNTRPAIAALCVFYETIMMMGVGAFIGATLFMCYNQTQWKYSAIALLVGVGALLPLIPPIFKRVVKLLRIGRGDEKMLESLEKLGFRTLFQGIALMVVLWIFFGLSLWCAIRGLGVETEPIIRTIPRYITASTLGVSLGFFVVASPGGLGVREAITAAVLTPYLGILLSNPENSALSITPDALSAIISIIQRIVSILSELVAFLLLGGFVLFYRSRLQEDEEELPRKA